MKTTGAIAGGAAAQTRLFTSEIETTPALDAAAAAQAFAARGSEPRLEVIRALVRAGPDGLAVGALLERVGAAPSTLTHHLKFLAAAGLLTQERQGRSQICRANFEAIESLGAFFTRECCRDVGAPCGEEPDA